MKHYDEAVSAIDHALALAPENANWWDSRGEICLKAGRHAEALESFE